MLGGRIEVLKRRFALEVPEGWQALDWTCPDLLARMEQHDATTRWLAASGTGPPADDSWDVEVIARWDGIGVQHECLVSGRSEAFLDLDDVASVAEEWYRDSTAARVDVSRILLPAGPAYRLDSDGGPEGSEEASEFLLLQDGWQLNLWCADATRHDDEWLSLARTIEFLPADE